MIKATYVGKICIVVFAVFFLCSCKATTSTKPNPNIRQTVINEGSGELRITIENGKLKEESCKSPDETPVVKKCFKGEVVDLKIVNTKGTDAVTDDVYYKTLNITDHTIIRVDPETANPGCTFYIWSGRWWQVCD